MLEAEQETIEKVLSDMGASLDNVPKGDREVLKAKLREEAWQPTKDAIGVRHQCQTALVHTAETRVTWILKNPYKPATCHIYDDCFSSKC